MGSSQSNSKRPRIVYQEFGTPTQEAALERGNPDLPPHQQTLKIQASRKGRGGKTVTVVSGFQQSPDQLMNLLKKLKNQLGTGGTLKDDTLELQGDRAQKVLEILTTLGYKAKMSGGS